MPRIINMRPRALVAAAVATLVAVACTGGAAHNGPPDRATSEEAPSNATTTNGLPNPFTIVARYPASLFGLHHPLDLAVGVDGNLYITDKKPSVTVVSPDGKFLRQWGRAGNGRGRFDFAPDTAGNLTAPIAVGPNGDVYVSDPGNGRIDVHTAAGKYVDQFGSTGIGDGQFMDNQTLAVDAGGNVYVADDLLESISKFSPAGDFVWTLQGNGSAADPGLRGHFHLEDVDAHGRIVAGVDDAHEIVYIDANRHKFDAFSVAGRFRNNWGPCDVTVDQLGDTLVQSCPDAGHPVAGVPSYQAALLFDRNHNLVGAWYDTPWSDFVAPQPGADGDWFALADDGSILKLKVDVPGCVI